MLKLLLILGLTFYIFYHFSGAIMRFLLRMAGKELEKKARKEHRKAKGVVYEKDDVTIRKRGAKPQEGEYVDYEEV